MPFIVAGGTPLMARPKDAAGEFATPPFPAAAPPVSAPSSAAATAFAVFNGNAVVPVAVCDVEGVP